MSADGFAGTSPGSAASIRGGRGLLAERVALAVALLAVILLVDPRGDFPLNDDWDFAAAAWNFARTGDLELTRHTAVSVRLQLVWGALWTVALGESFEVLRASTLTLSLATLLLLHSLLGRIGLPAWGRMGGSLALLTHPVFLWSSFTFMTEIPFLLLSVATVYAFTRGWSERRTGFVGAGAVAAIGSFFVRQTGLAHAGGPLLLALLGARAGPRRRMFGAALTTVIAFVAIYLATDLLEPRQLSEHAQLGDGPVSWLTRFGGNLVQYTIANVQLSLLFFLPLTAAALVSGSVSPRRLAVPAAGFGAVFVLAAAPFLIVGAPVRSALLWRETRLGNLFVNWGLGPRTLFDTAVLDMPFPRHLGHGARAGLTLALAVLAALALARIWAERDRLFRGDAAPVAAVVLALGNGLAASLLLALSVIYLDRYALSSLWVAALILVRLIRWNSRPARVVLAFGLIVTGALALVGTREYLAWNRARWEAFDRLRARGIPAAAIDGGYEINSWNAVWGEEGMIDRDLERPPGRWVLSFRPLEDSAVLERVGSGGATVYALELGSAPSVAEP